MLRLICVEDGASKFWEGEVEGNSVVIRFGKVGSRGQRQVKELASPAAAQKELDKRAAEKRKKGYVDEAGAATPAHAFLFYGAHPGDWNEGSNCGYTFYVRFAAAPSDPERAAAEKAFHDRLFKSEAADCGCGDWEWQDEWVTFNVGDRYVEWRQKHDGASTGLYRALWDDVADAILHMHAVLPIAEVVNANAFPHGKDPWTQWSYAQKAEPGEPPAPPSTAEDDARAAAAASHKASTEDRRRALHDLLQRDPAAAETAAIAAAEDHELRDVVLEILATRATDPGFEALLALFDQGWGAPALIARSPHAGMTDRLLARVAKAVADSKDDSMFIGARFLEALAARRDPASLPRLLALLEELDRGTNFAAWRGTAEALAAFDDARAVETVRRVLAGASGWWSDRRSAEKMVLAVLERATPQHAYDLLSPHLLRLRDGGERDLVAERGLDELARLLPKGLVVDPRWVELCLELLDAPPRGLDQSSLNDVVGHGPHPRYADLLIARHAAGKPMQPTFLSTLGKTRDPRAVPVLRSFLTDPSTNMILAAASGLSRYQDPAISADLIEPLCAALARVDSDLWVKRARPVFERIATRALAPRIRDLATAVTARPTRNSRDKESAAELAQAITALATAVEALPT